ncbi:hypothetical protein ASF09_08585 [Sphingomonas sp. Leaf242]|nr:hypothetical protein ASF09_08585 [Sphingomonas sp. Leaf242]
MGFRVSWMAVSGVNSDALLAHFGFRDTGVLDAANESLFSIAELGTGWTVLWSNDEAFASDETAALLSQYGPVLAVCVNETCMHSTAVMFENKTSRWRLHHEGDKVLDHLVIEGNLPFQASAMIADFRAKQAHATDVDFMFDIPLEVARSICGFKHDLTELDGIEPAFTVVEAGGQRRQTGLWNRLMGR